MPEISIIVPVYKVEKYLDRCVKSILDQTYTDFELILVDDGSPDHCPAMCDAWAEKDGRIRVVHKENGGVSSARNVGLDIMTGNYVMFIDSDDAVHPEICSVLCHLIISENADIAICGSTKFDTNEMPNSKIITLSDQYETYDGDKIFRRESIFENCRPAPWGKLYIKKIFDHIRFKVGITYEDLHLYPYILHEAHKIINYKTPLYYYFFPQNEDKSAMLSPLSPKKFIAIDIRYEHYIFYRQSGAERSAAISAYHLLVQFAKASILQHENKELKRVFIKYYFRYLLKITAIPRRYLSVKNKIIYLSTVLPVNHLKKFYMSNYCEEQGFEDPKNL